MTAGLTFLAVVLVVGGLLSSSRARIRNGRS